MEDTPDNSKFTFVDYEVDRGSNVITFRYRSEHEGKHYDLAETLKLPIPIPEESNEVFGRIVRALHVALGISYYKTFVQPHIEHPYALDQMEADFWNEVYLGGLGEFLYVNQLHQSVLAKFTSTATHSEPVPPGGNWHRSALLGIGGGKDSIVAGELLKKMHIPVKGFVLGTGENYGLAANVAKTMGVEMLGVERTLDPQILEMNKMPGAYNGHIPISMVFALVGCLLASAEGSQYVVVANESAASIPNLEWEDMDINHQWSKSLLFEKLFQAYVWRYITPELNYFSAIRPLSSVAVAKAFSKFSEYFEIFTSDNSIFKIDPSKRPHGRWSTDSPKTLSSYILLAAWLDTIVLERIFGRNYMNEHDLKRLFLELTGVEGIRPLDCVGTTEEINLSLNILAKKALADDTYLMQIARENNIINSNSDWEAEITKALTMSTDHAFPMELSKELTENLQGMI